MVHNPLSDGVGGALPRTSRIAAPGRRDPTSRFSGGFAPFVAMVKSPDTRQRDDGRCRRRPRRNGSFVRGVFVQSQVDAVVVIISQVAVHKPSEMTLVENDDVLEEFSTTAANPALRHRVLPGTAVGDATRLGAHGFHEPYDGRTEDGVTIEEEMPRCGVVGKGLPQLLDHPRRRRVEGGIEVQDVSSAMLDDEEPVENLEGERGHGEDMP